MRHWISGFALLIVLAGASLGAEDPLLREAVDAYLDCRWLPDDEADSSETSFTPLVPVPDLKILASSEAYPGGSYDAENLLDGAEREGTGGEYATANQGTETFVVLDLGETRRVAAFRHVERKDPAIIKASRLTFANDPELEEPVQSIDVKHAGLPAGITFVRFPPVKARYLRWDVTEIGPHGTVGGAELEILQSEHPEPVPSRTALELETQPIVLTGSEGRFRVLKATIQYPYAESTQATLEATGAPPRSIQLSLGTSTLDVPIPESTTGSDVHASITVGGQEVARDTTPLKPVRDWVVYLLPHSHVDIGYTHRQDEVERIQWRHFETAIDLARRTADYPEGARFKWNVEVLWAVDGYLRHAPEAKRQEFLEAVKRGWIGLDALYGNQLMGLARPEELFRTVEYAGELARRAGVAIDSAMISDVPGCSWGLVPALVQSGVRYFSPGPNHMPHLPHQGDRIGYTLETWGDRPFYWVSPSGKEKLLVWMSSHGYSWFHGWILGSIEKAGATPILGHLRKLEEAGYPYDLVQLRYTVNGDNGPPDPDLPGFVRDWNAKHAVPRLEIATTSTMFREMERRHGSKLPSFRGDFTPYWEDGAASSARETALSREAAERLVQAEALWAMLAPRRYPRERFQETWRDIILFSEHTWGAHNSVSQPESEFVRSLWTVKQAFAEDAAKESKALLTEPLALLSGGDAFHVINVSSWTRSDLVVLPARATRTGDVVRDAAGDVVASQRLESGDLAFLARSLPPFGSRRFTIHAGEAAQSSGGARAEERCIANDLISVTVDPKTGDLKELRWKGAPMNLADTSSGPGLNSYVYLSGKDPAAAVHSGKTRIVVGESGPLVASLVVESEAPGCRGLRREIRLIDGLPRVDVINVVDKEPVRSKESVHFGYPFAVPDGQVRIDGAWAIIRPDEDQLEGANRNCFSAQRWVDVSNRDFGITLATIDAPLVELGAVHAEEWDLERSRPWLRDLPRTQTVYSYVMNNYWHTNYRAYQEGPVRFRYSLRPHGKFDPAETKRFGIERSQPLIVAPSSTEARELGSRITVEPDNILVSSVRPLTDGTSLLLRLFNAGNRVEAAQLRCPSRPSVRLHRSNPQGERIAPISGSFSMGPMGIITIRVDESEP